MEQITRGESGRLAARVGVDLAKRVIQVHALYAAGRLLTSRALARERFLPWCTQLPTGCVKEERTACINRIRGLLAEFGLVVAQSPKVLRMSLADVLEGASNEMGTLARLTLQRADVQWRELDEHLAWCDERVAEHVRSSEPAHKATTLLGVGPITASAVVATVGDFRQFSNGAQFGAWVGLTPRQRSSGGKTKLGRITKRGDTYLRTLLIQAAKSAVLTAHRRSDKISPSVREPRDRSGWQVAAVALANKNARIIWALMTKGAAFDPNHCSIKPGASPRPA